MNTASVIALLKHQFTPSEPLICLRLGMDYYISQSTICHAKGLAISGSSSCHGSAEATSAVFLFGTAHYPWLK